VVNLFKTQNSCQNSWGIQAALNHYAKIAGEFSASSQNSVSIKEQGKYRLPGELRIKILQKLSQNSL
jgi:hypothetical protein